MFVELFSTTSSLWVYNGSTTSDSFAVDSAREPAAGNAVTQFAIELSTFGGLGNCTVSALVCRRSGGEAVPHLHGVLWTHQVTDDCTLTFGVGVVSSCRVSR